jgi:Zn-dependent protease
MQIKPCTDRVVGDILSSWRYDISGITPEMRRDYEQHLLECAHCRSRQRLHRTIDVVLIGVSTVSIAAFLLGLAVIYHLRPLQHWELVNLHLWQMSFVLSLQAAAIAGLLFSLLVWVLVAVATPAPVYLAEVALAQARVLQDRIPEELRERLMRNVA